jgi:hypothetical protein
MWLKHAHPTCTVWLPTTIAKEGEGASCSNNKQCLSNMCRTNSTCGAWGSDTPVMGTTNTGSKFSYSSQHACQLGAKQLLKTVCIGVNGTAMPRVRFPVLSASVD